MLLAPVAEVVEEDRRLLDHLAALLVLTVKDPKRVPVSLLHSLRREGPSPIRENRGGPSETFPAYLASDTVHLDRIVLHPQISQNKGDHPDKFRIDHRLGDAKDLDVHLVELPESPFLRPLVTEHGPDHEELARPFFRVETKPEGRPSPHRPCLPAASSANLRSCR